MNFSKYRFNLDMQSHISQVSLPVRHLDTGRKLFIGLTDGGNPYIIENGCRAVFYGMKADGNPIMNDCIIEKNTTIRYDLTEQTTACEGIVDCEIRLYSAEGYLITSPKFIMVVDSRVVHDEDFPLSESEQTILDNIILSETARAAAEDERISAEAARAAAEEQRQNASEDVLETLEIAKTLANELKARVESEEFDAEEIKRHNADAKAHKGGFGEGNEVGLKGYWVSAVGTALNQVVLSAETARENVAKPTVSEYVDADYSSNIPYAIGDEFSIITPKNHYNLCGKITDIMYNRIGVEYYTEIDWDAGDPLDIGDYSFCVPSKAHLGLVTISEGGFPTGYGTRAGGVGSTSSGALTNGHGDYSDAGGLRTKAGYCGFTRGSDNRADAKYSSVPGGINNKVGVNGQQGFIGGGNENEVDAYSGSARNGKNRVYANYGDASGFNTEVSVGATAARSAGQNTKVKAPYASADGFNNTVEAEGIAGHISGIGNLLNGKAAYVGGEDCQAYYWWQFEHGRGLRSSLTKLAQAILGNYNKVNDDAVFQVGNGVLDSARSNAFEIISKRDGGNNIVSMVLGNTEMSEEVFASLASRAKIVTGSYVGTGLYYESAPDSPNSLTFDFVPRLVGIVGYKTSSGSYSPTLSVGESEHIVDVIVPSCLSTSYGAVGTGFGASSKGKVSADRKTIYWYSSVNTASQLNYSNNTYFYYALG